MPESRHWPLVLAISVASRAIAWLLLCGFLAFEIVLAVYDWQQFRADPETFHRVYEQPWLEQAIVRSFGVLSAAGLVLQLRGWRRQRFSRIALSVPLLNALFFAANETFGILVTWCG